MGCSDCGRYLHVVDGLCVVCWAECAKALRQTIDELHGTRRPPNAWLERYRSTIRKQADKIIDLQKHIAELEETEVLRF